MANPESNRYPDHLYHSLIDFPIRDVIGLPTPDLPRNNLLEQIEPIDFAVLGRDIMSSITRYPDPQAARDIISSIRLKSGISEQPYISLHAGSNVLQVIEREFITPETHIMGKEPEYLGADGLDKLLFTLQQKDGDTSTTEDLLIYIPLKTEQTDHLSRMEKLTEIVKISDKHNFLVVIDEPPLVDTSLSTSAVSLTEQYNSVMVLKNAGVPGMDLGWTYMSEEIGKYYRHVEIPYSPRSVQLAFLKLLFPSNPDTHNDTTNHDHIIPQTTASFYEGPFRTYFYEQKATDDMVRKTASESDVMTYVHDRHETPTDQRALEKVGPPFRDLSQGELKLEGFRPNLFWFFDTPEQYASVGKLLYESAMEPADNTITQSIKTNLKKAAGAPESMEVILGNGSDELLKMLFRHAKKENIQVWGHALQFPQGAIYASSTEGGYEYVLGETLTVTDGVREMITKLKAEKEAGIRKQRIFYICHPNTPAGDTLDPTVAQELLALSDELGCITVFDQAFIYTLPPEESLISLVANSETGIVIESASKGSGLAGSALGWGFMKEGLAEKIKPFENKISGPQLVLLNALSQPGVIEQFRELVQPMVNYYKGSFVGKLREKGIYVPITNKNSLICAIMSPPKVPIRQGETLHSFLLKFCNLMTAEGSAFQITDPHAGDLVRVATPFVDEDEMDEIVNYFVLAYNHLQEQHEARI